MSSKTNRISKRSNNTPRSSKTTKSTPSTSTIPNPTPDTMPSPPTGPIYFWRPQEATTGYLSQWYAQPFRDRTDPNKIYATAEHYMMHHKALLFHDAEIAAAILEADSPRDVKQLGRAVRGFDGVVWEKERERIVVEGNWCKFSLPVLQNLETEEGVERKDEKEKEEEGEEEKGETEGEEVSWKLSNADTPQTLRARSFRAVLLATGTRELVEASPFDRIWGVGFAAKGAEKNRRKWGLNLLGKCLMEVREQFRREAEDEGKGAVDGR